MAIAKLALFSGYVQGVGFRFTAKQVAQRYELTGYVRNRDDGKVEMRLQGDPQDIQDCIDDLKDAFNIRDVKIDDADFNSSFKDFGIAL